MTYIYSKLLMRNKPKSKVNYKEVSKRLKVLGHPKRLELINYLAKVKKCNCNELVEHLKISQPSVSQHIKELKKTDLIHYEREGYNIFCSINNKTFNGIEHFFESIQED